ncbi:NmrA-like domain-containing protein [Mycena polygramma]|nr:NmrA-like domain-containing protein [Mycena polygramma]
MSRVVAIVGATGLQGSSVLEALLKDGTFTPRAISRDPESEAAQKLKARGVDVVKGDTADKASLVSALRGSEGVFAVTLRNIVDAAKEAGVKFFILSSVPGLTKLTKGRFTQVSLYDDRAVIEEYLQASGIPNASLHLGSFTENLWTCMLPPPSSLLPSILQVSPLTPRHPSQRAMKPSPTGSGFVITIPKYTPQSGGAIYHLWAKSHLP